MRDALAVSVRTSPRRHGGLCRPARASQPEENGARDARTDASFPVGGFQRIQRARAVRSTMLSAVPNSGIRLTAGAEKSSLFRAIFRSVRVS